DRYPIVILPCSEPVVIPRRKILQILPPRIAPARLLKERPPLRPVLPEATIQPRHPVTRVTVQLPPIPERLAVLPPGKPSHPSRRRINDRTGNLPRLVHPETRQLQTQERPHIVGRVETPEQHLRL